MKLKEASHALAFILLVDRYVLLKGLVTDHGVKEGTSSLSSSLSHCFSLPLSSLSLLTTSLSSDFEPDLGCGLTFTAETALLA